MMLVIVLNFISSLVFLVATEKCPSGILYDALKAKCVCPRDMYHDTITRRCTDCYNICNNAAHQRTSDECNSLCPDYHLPSHDMPVSAEEEEEAGAGEICTGDMQYDNMKMKCVCPKDMFYDEVTRRCSSCYVICYHADIQMTQDACNFSCPDYHLPFTTIVPHLISTPSSDFDYHKEVTIVFVCIIVIITFIGIVIAVYCGKCKKKGVCLLPCVRRVGSGTEAETDRFHENVQLAVNMRQEEVFDVQQPHDDGVNGMMAPSGLTTNEVNEETKLKVGLNH
ncbi:uncharacterized protein LOC128555170 [Mercenaria mercenaria]|uniref:uncharacterized protein LOC128555170 n=1 Tax=Mercenaria mercenaria TaxID=6596 RepID=UPI00234E5FEC|nr:uncharacterized protein LOC128555170 [Mercenaria mercenaria]